MAWDEALIRGAETTDEMTVSLGPPNVIVYEMHNVAALAREMRAEWDGLAGAVRELVAKCRALQELVISVGNPSAEAVAAVNAVEIALENIEIEGD